MKLAINIQSQLLCSLALLFSVMSGSFFAPISAQNNFSFTPKNAKPDKISPELKAALIFYKSHNYAQAQKQMESLAKNGDAVAARYLGAMYEEGIEGKPDFAKAEQWLRQAALKNDLEAQVRLAGVINFRRGDKTPKDAAETSYWLLKAADGGSLMAQSKIGSRYMNGLGVPQNPALAFKYREMAARQGDEKCALRAAKQIFNGDGIAADPVKAVALYKIAATSFPEACRKLNRIYLHGAPGIAPDAASAKLWRDKAITLEKAYKDDNASILDSLGTGR